MHPVLLAPLILTRLHLQMVEPAMERQLDQQLRAPIVRSNELPLHFGHRRESVGKGVAVVFSPDLAPPGNQPFYEWLGFAYIESADWSEVLCRLEEIERKGTSLSAVIVESHGTNGNGLKLQSGKSPDALRSYISLGGLQERLEPIGLNVVFVSACNAGRLFRPHIFNAIDRRIKDPLFLPATAGIIDARHPMSPQGSPVHLLRRNESKLETLLEGSIDDFPSTLRAQLDGKLERTPHFSVSTMLMQLVMRDPSLTLTSSGYVEEKSRENLGAATTEAIYDRFVAYLSALP